MAKQAISNYINNICDLNLRKSCKKILDTPEFFTHPASTGMHHGYIGGLAVHTLEVLNYAVDFAESFPQTNLDIVISAGLWHDYAKIWDYKLETFFKGQYNDLPKYYVLAKDHEDYKKVYISNLEYKSQIHHVTGSTCEFTAEAVSCGVDRKTIQKVQACIISHHGRKDWGSIKEPDSLESMILHYADNLSAKYGERKDK